MTQKSNAHVLPYVHHAQGLNYWLLIILITIIYYASARLGQLLAPPPGYISAAWPPSGIALAAMLLFGYKLWPAIFLGSFFNNFFLLEENIGSVHTFSNAFVAIAVGLGASLQAFAGSYLIKHYANNRDPFAKAENAFKFLILSLLSTLINSNLGLIAFCLAKVISWNKYFSTWLTWWLGDTTGIYVFTPLILAWMKQRTWRWTLLRALEVAAILACIFILAAIGHMLHLPIAYAFIPLILWATFRFKQIGATSTIFLVSLIGTIGVSQLKGPFAAIDYYTSILMLAAFIAIVSSTTLLLLGTIEENKRTQQLLEKYSHNLEGQVTIRTKQLREKLQQLQEMQKQIVSQEKLASLGKLTAGIAHEIKNPLNFISNFSDLSLKLSQKIQTEFEKHKDLFDQRQYETILKNFNFLNLNISKIIEHGKKADNIIQGMLLHAHEKSIPDQPTDVNALCQEYLKLAYHGMRGRDPSFNVKMETQFDSSLKTINTDKQGLSRVFLNLVNNALYAVHQKKIQKGDSYEPIITVKTQHRDENMTIMVKDNGNGIPNEIKDKIFVPFFTTKAPGDGTGLGLSISHDIIVGLGGDLIFQSVQGEYTEFTIILPIR